eukprot:TRINITY_DN22161_c0_g2_i1.p1 TRINITY_DN22161_c0_g2~~TRINITY_DN22161_c0_g2_i1.p1  ORF type:complete len:504 (+),score=59.79 TRINITY_DN22161_c0_g2_i1:111-1622(+)
MSVRAAGGRARRAGLANVLHRSAAPARPRPSWGAEDTTTSQARQPAQDAAAAAAPAAAAGNAGDSAQQRQPARTAAETGPGKELKGDLQELPDWGASDDECAAWFQRKYNRYPDYPSGAVGSKSVRPGQILSGIEMLVSLGCDVGPLTRSELVRALCSVRSTRIAVSEIRRADEEGTALTARAYATVMSTLPGHSAEVAEVWRYACKAGRGNDRNCSRSYIRACSRRVRALRYAVFWISRDQPSEHTEALLSEYGSTEAMLQAADQLAGEAVHLLGVLAGNGCPEPNTVANVIGALGSYDAAHALLRKAATEWGVQPGSRMYIALVEACQDNVDDARKAAAEAANALELGGLPHCIVGPLMGVMRRAARPAEAIALYKRHYTVDCPSSRPLQASVQEGLLCCADLVETRGDRWHRAAVAFHGAFNALPVTWCPPVWATLLQIYAKVGDTARLNNVRDTMYEQGAQETNDMAEHISRLYGSGAHTKMRLVRSVNWDPGVKRPMF